MTQKEFIAAYLWMFGGTKKAAKEIYKNADQEYIDNIIKAYNKQNIIAFWED